MPQPTHFALKALWFLNLLADDATCLSWTKIGVAGSTFFAGVTGFAATIQSVIGTAAHTDWQMFAGAIALHGVTSTARRAKIALDKPPSGDTA